MTQERLHTKVADWVFDPRNTAGRASAYDHMLMTYWVTMHMVGHSSAMKEAKGEGDAKLVPFWKEHKVSGTLCTRKLTSLQPSWDFLFIQLIDELWSMLGLGKGTMEAVQWKQEF